MVKGKIVEKGNYLRERVENPTTLRRQGYTRFRTIQEGDHKVIIAAKGSPHDGGHTKVQAILHPKSEASKLMERSR